MGDYRITADYPGAARRYIESALGGGTTTGFLPGCFGDVRPNCTFLGGKRFRRGQPEDVTAFGEALGGEVLRILEGPMQPLTPRLGGRSLVVDLPLAQPPSREELEEMRETGSPLERTWAARLLSEPMVLSRPLSLQRLDLAREAILLALGGEACCDYGHFIKSQRSDAFLVPLGYTNGLVGYLPSARLFPEGGYEVIGSYKLFGLPAPFKPTIEGLIREGIRALLTTGL
jgi:hypothetical protein